MGRLPQGASTAHMQQSHAADADSMKFYSTAYSTAHNQDGFIPRTGKHVGTGYLSNYRTGVYYGQRIDQLDNPAMEKIVRKNYKSITKMHFIPTEGSDGCDPFPTNLKQGAGSGFTRQVPITTPLAETIRNVCADTRYPGIGASIVGVRPRHMPFLHKLRPKDPVASELGARGPGFMSTECSANFRGTPNQRLDVSTKTVGRKMGSGFTHSFNDIDPINFHLGSSFANDRPGCMTSRPTGISDMKTTYLPLDHCKGDEPFPIVSQGSSRGSGFTYEKRQPFYYDRVMRNAYTTPGQVPRFVEAKLRKSDPSDYLNMTNPDNHSSISSKMLTGRQRSLPSESERLARCHQGSQELSGFVDNSVRLQAELPIEPMCWISHHDTRFYDMNVAGRAKAGRAFGNVMPQQLNGFTKNTSNHSFGPDIDTTAKIRSLEPYVARSIKVTDTFYDDHTHDSKKYVPFNSNQQHQIMTSV